MVTTTAQRPDVEIPRTKELTRRFGELTAVDRVNLEIRAGETFGLLGPKGAGKTFTGVNVHLTGPGYHAWVEVIRPLVASRRTDLSAPPAAFQHG